jgi:hypothetical protein
MFDMNNFDIFMFKKSCYDAYALILNLNELIKNEIGELKRLNQPHEEWRVPFFTYTFC